MIDIHIILNPKTPPAWKDVCLASITGDVNIQTIPQENRSISENRIIGFSLGNSEYVSYVDDDDIVLNNAFAHCEKYLNDNPDVSVVGTLETVIKDGVMVKEAESSKLKKLNIVDEMPEKIIAALHHVIVFRRSVLEKYIDTLKTDFPYPEKMLLKAMYEAGEKMKVLPIVGYAWRIHENNFHKSIG